MRYSRMYYFNVGGREYIYIYTLYNKIVNLYLYNLNIYDLFITNEYLSNIEVCNYSNGIFLIVHLQFVFVYTVDLSAFVLPTVK